MEINVDFLNSIFTPTLAVGMITFLCHKYIENFFKTKSTAFELELQKKSEIEISNFKSKIEIENLALKTKIQGIYQKQLEAILSIYASLTELDHSFTIALSQGPSDPVHYQTFTKTYSNFSQEYKKQKILLPKKTDDIFKVILEDSFMAVHIDETTEKQLKQSQHLSDETIDRIFIQKQKGHDLEKTLPQLSQQLIQEFRDYIGNA